jgi:UDP-GlcNAc:undecaprenyl-phosphate/decaprenyl-phosphate GlcNAc-1-phosphate transferase
LAAAGHSGMWQSIFAGPTSFLISFAFLPFIITFSKKKNLVSVPGRRRIHKAITPSIGGAAIFSGFTLALTFWASHAHLDGILILLPILIIPFIVGLIDDLITLKPVAKLLAEAITASLIFFTLEIQLTSFYGLLGDRLFPEPVSYIVTLITVIIITNSLNLIDGIDGLAGVLSFISILAFGTWFFLTGNYSYAMVCFAAAGGILAFLFQNWEPSKIFMGDTGSLVIGTLLSILTIKFINENLTIEKGNEFRFTSSVGAAIAIIIIPLIDTIRIIIIRIRKGLPLFTGDKRHIHHALVRLGLSHRQVVYILALAHISFIGLSIILMRAKEGYLLLAILVLATSLCIALDKIVKMHFARTETKTSSRG